MKFESHLNALKKRHKALSEQVEEMQRSPGRDSLKLADLKKQKLRLKERIKRVKEEMERLQNGKRLTAATLPEVALEDLLDYPESEKIFEQQAKDSRSASIDLAA